LIHGTSLRAWRAIGAIADLRKEDIRACMLKSRR
jgi:hypothetical protein